MVAAKAGTGGNGRQNRSNCLWKMMRRRKETTTLRWAENGREPEAYDPYLLGSARPISPGLPAWRRPIGGCVALVGVHRPAPGGAAEVESSPCSGSAARFKASSSPATMARAVGRAASQPPAAAAPEKPSGSADRRLLYFAAFLLLADAALVALIISFVRYTKIDWDAYMSQVDAFLEGERDYSKIEGDTGPLVYPAGFLYVYSAVKFITGGQVFPAQILFGLLYIVNLSLVLLLYVKTEVLPWWALGLLCLSKRIHSIFVLRLFNDCFAMTLLHAAMVFIVYHKWYLGLIVFSGAVSIKMNVLLFAPSLLLLMLKTMSIKGVFLALLGAAVVQVLLGMPFLLLHPVHYISRAFNLGRVFIHFWSVNFKFIPEKLFVSKELGVALLILHLTTLVVFAHYKWLKHEGGLIGFMHSRYKSAKSIQQLLSCKPGSSDLSKEHIVTVLFVGNFIGIVCARSLHYQFYSWYFYSLPFLLWKTCFPTALRIILFAGVELCWNIYPSTAYSSLVLLFLHVAILFGIWLSPSEYPYVKRRT